jgi:hypothetical protein
MEDTTISREADAVRSDEVAPTVGAGGWRDFLVGRGSTTSPLQDRRNLKFATK